MTYTELRAILIMGSNDIEKVAQLQFSELRKTDRAERLGNDIRPTGAKLYQQARYYVGANCDFTHSTRLGRGRCPYDPELRKIKKENKRNER